MSVFNNANTTEPIEPTQQPYDVSPEDIYSTSLTSVYYNKTEVDNLVFVGMCELYDKVIPQSKITPEFFDQLLVAGIQPPEPQMPYHTTISSQSYVYTSVYKHNKFEVMIMEQNPGMVSCRMYVRFTIVPKYTPTKECRDESRQIEKLILDVIHNKVEDHFQHLEHEDWIIRHEKDRHSNRGYDDF